MHFINKNKKLILPPVLLLIILMFLLYGVKDATGNAERLQSELTMHAITRALADCYAIEGHYPPNIQYLFDNYGVKVDEEQFFILYRVFAPNISPTVRLIDRRQMP